MSREDTQSLLEAMGFSPHAINQSLSMINDFSDIETLVQLCTTFSEDTVAASTTLGVGGGDGGYKMVLLVNCSLGMSPGKVASQCVHAALGATRTSDPGSTSEWTHTGEKVVALEVQSEDQMQGLLDSARSLNLNSFACHDAGRTEVESGTRTVCAIGPHPESKIDLVTGSLNLY